MQNSSESPRFWGVGVAYEGEKFTMADFDLMYLSTSQCLGLHMVFISWNHRLNAIHLSKNNEYEINYDKLYDMICNSLQFRRMSKTYMHNMQNIIMKNNMHNMTDMNPPSYICIICTPHFADVIWQCQKYAKCAKCVTMQSSKPETI